MPPNGTGRRVSGGGGGRARPARLYGHAGARGMAGPAPTMSAMRWRSRRSPPATAPPRRSSRSNSLCCMAVLGYGQRGAETALSGADGERRDARRLLPDRAAGRLRRRGDQDAGAPPRQSLGAQRHQAVHHLGQERRGRARLRGHRPGCRPKRASAPLSCRPTARVIASPASSTSSASAPPTPRSWSSKTWS